MTQSCTPVFVVAIIIVFSGCRHTPNGPEDPFIPQVHSVTIQRNLHNVVSVLVTVHTSKSSAVAVEYGIDSLRFQTTPFISVVADSALVPVLGLRASTIYIMRVVAVSPTGFMTRDELRTFITDSLPSDIPRFSVVVNNNPLIGEKHSFPKNTGPVLQQAAGGLQFIGD